MAKRKRTYGLMAAPVNVHKGGMSLADVDKYLRTKAPEGTWQVVCLIGQPQKVTVQKVEKRVAVTVDEPVSKEPVV